MAAPTPDYIGITLVSGDTYIQKVTIKRSPGYNEKHKLADGTPGPAHVGDFKDEVTIERIGTSDETAGAALAASIEELTGATHVSKISRKWAYGEVNTETVTAEHYADATRAT